MARKRTMRLKAVSVDTTSLANTSLRVEFQQYTEKGELHIVSGDLDLTDISVLAERMHKHLDWVQIKLNTARKALKREA